MRAHNLLVQGDLVCDVEVKCVLLCRHLQTVVLQKSEARMM